MASSSVVSAFAKAWCVPFHTVALWHRAYVRPPRIKGHFRHKKTNLVWIIDIRVIEGFEQASGSMRIIQPWPAVIFSVEGLAVEKRDNKLLKKFLEFKCRVKKLALFERTAQTGTVLDVYAEVPALDEINTFYIKRRKFRVEYLLTFRDSYIVTARQPDAPNVIDHALGQD